MATLVYECHVDCSVTFQHVRSMSPLERIRLMMNRVRLTAAAATTILNV